MPATAKHHVCFPVVDAAGASFAKVNSTLIDQAYPVLLCIWLVFDAMLWLFGLVSNLFCAGSCLQCRTPFMKVPEVP